MKRLADADFIFGYFHPARSARPPCRLQLAFAFAIVSLVPFEASNFIAFSIFASESHLGPSKLRLLRELRRKGERGDASRRATFYSMMLRAFAVESNEILTPRSWSVYVDDTRSAGLVATLNPLRR